MTAPALTPGTWWVDAPCPRCGEVEPLPLSIGVVLTVPGDDTPTVKVTAKGGKAPHSCGQTRLRVELSGPVEVVE